MEIKQEKEILTHPYAMFMYAIKSPLTRKKYEGRLAKFFNFTRIAGEASIYDLNMVNVIIQYIKKH